MTNGEKIKESRKSPSVCQRLAPLIIASPACFEEHNTKPKQNPLKPAGFIQTKKEAQLSCAAILLLQNLVVKIHVPRSAFSDYIGVLHSISSINKNLHLNVKLFSQLKPDIGNNTHRRLLC